MRLEIGQIIGTTYSETQHQIKTIYRSCVCTHILDSIEHRDLPLPPHTHLVLKDLRDGDEAYIGYLDETDLRYYGEGGKKLDDMVIILPNLMPVQQSLL